MLKVKCYSGYKMNERPMAFTIQDRDYEVAGIIDRWYGEGSAYFKVEADDKNIYLLKYDERKDDWELIFYQNPGRLKTAQLTEYIGFHPISRPVSRAAVSKRYTPLN